MKTILAVDDDPAILFVYKELFEKSYKLLTAKNGLEALEKMAENKIDLLITDIKMPDMHGIELIQNVRKINQNLPIIVCTAFQYMRDDYEVVNSNIAQYITKPFKNDELVQLVGNLVAR